MRFTIILGVLSLTLASGALLLNESLPDLLRDQMSGIELEGVVGFGNVSLTSKRELTVRDATLTDPGTGRVVASVNQLDMRFDIPWEDSVPTPELRAIHGHGGRVLLRYEAGDIGLVRSIIGLLDGIEALLPPDYEDDPTSELPELFFEDLEVMVYSEGLPLERYLGTSVRIRDLNEEILEVMIATGSDGGTLQLLFDDDGLTKMVADGLPVGPAVTTLDPVSHDILTQGFSPRGNLDAVLDFDLSSVALTGTLTDAYVDADYVPFLLGPATIPFSVDEENVLRIDKAAMGFDGGEVVLSIEANEHDSKIRVDVEGAEFREAIMQLIPDYDHWEAVDVSDGGSFECHLDINVNSVTSETTVSGDGGFHIEHVALAPYDIDVQDVVGRFEVTEQDVLSFPDVSGRLLGGRVRASGTLGLADLKFRVALAAEDLDVAELHRLRTETKDRTDEVAGWLQGRVQGGGTLQDPRSYVADGQASIRAGNFWDTPTFEQILKVLTMSNNTDGHQRVDANFSVSDRMVRVQPLEIQSDVLSLSGSGTIRFNGTIRFELRPAPVRLGMFGKVLDTIKEELLVKLTVRGTLDDPRVTATPLNIVARPFRSFWNFLFGGAPADDSPGDLQVDPLPEEAPSDG